jgi:hypothetical protein
MMAGVAGSLIVAHEEKPDAVAPPGEWTGEVHVARLLTVDEPRGPLPWEEALRQRAAERGGPQKTTLFGRGEARASP